MVVPWSHAIYPLLPGPVAIIEDPEKGEGAGAERSSPNWFERGVAFLGIRRKRCPRHGSDELLIENFKFHNILC